LFITMRPRPVRTTEDTTPVQPGDRVEVWVPLPSEYVSPVSRMLIRKIGNGLPPHPISIPLLKVSETNTMHAGPDGGDSAEPSAARAR